MPLIGVWDNPSTASLVFETIAELCPRVWRWGGAV